MKYKEGVEGGVPDERTGGWGGCEGGAKAEHMRKQRKQSVDPARTEVGHYKRGAEGLAPQRAQVREGGVNGK